MFEVLICVSPTLHPPKTTSLIPAAAKNVHFFFQEILYLHANTFPTENSSMTGDCS